MNDLGNYEAQDEVFQALRNSNELSTLAKGGFFNRVADKDADFPRVVFTQINDSPSKHADNKEVKATVYFQISIFTNAETVSFEKEIYKEIERVMNSLEYGRYDYQGLYETDTKLHHLALRYEKNFY